MPLLGLTGHVGQNSQMDCLIYMQAICDCVDCDIHNFLIDRTATLWRALIKFQHPYLCPPLCENTELYIVTVLILMIRTVRKNTVNALVSLNVPECQEQGHLEPKQTFLWY